MSLTAYRSGLKMDVKIFPDILSYISGSNCFDLFKQIFSSSLFFMCFLMKYFLSSKPGLTRQISYFNPIKTFGKLLRRSEFSTNLHKSIHTLQYLQTAGNSLKNLTLSLPAESLWLFLRSQIYSCVKRKMNYWEQET